MYIDNNSQTDKNILLSYKTWFTTTAIVPDNMTIAHCSMSYTHTHINSLRTVIVHERLWLLALLATLTAAMLTAVTSCPLPVCVMIQLLNYTHLDHVMLPEH